MSNSDDLKNMGLKATIPRLKILALFEKTEIRHLTAEDVYRLLLAENLDIGLATGPTLSRFFAGPNEAALQHLRLWAGEGSQPDTRSPVPTYLWGEAGSGKTHLLKAVRQALSDQGASVGWLDASVAMPAEFDERWATVLLGSPLDVDLTEVSGAVVSLPRGPGCLPAYRDALDGLVAALDMPSARAPALTEGSAAMRTLLPATKRGP